MGTMNKLTKIVLSFLMVITCINFSTVQAEDGEEVNYSEPTTVETVSEDPANEVEQEVAPEEPVVEEEATVEEAPAEQPAEEATPVEEPQQEEVAPEASEEAQVEEVNNAPEEAAEPQQEETAAPEEPQEEAKEEVQYPAFNATIEEQGVTLSASEGIFPQGTTVSATDKSDDDAVVNALEATISAANGENLQATGFVAYDFSFVDASGNKVEPKGDVSVTYSNISTTIPSSEVYRVYHVTDDGNVEVVEDSKVTVSDGQVTFTANSFSSYAVVGYNTIQVAVNAEDTENSDANTSEDNIALAANINSKTITKGKTETLTATKKQKVTWKVTSDNDVVSISSSTKGSNWEYATAKIKANKIGNATVTNGIDTWNIEVVANSYTVSFNINGGNGTTPSNVTVGEGKIITLPSGDAFSRSNYELAGWSENSNAIKTYENVGQYPIYPCGEKFEVTKNTTLYAVWAQNSGKFQAKLSVAVRTDGNTPGEPSINYDEVYKYYVENVTVDNILKYISPAKTVAGVAAVKTVLTDAFYQMITDKNAANKGSSTRPYYDPDTQYIEWYVVKYQNNDNTFHVDGTIKDKNVVTLSYDKNGATSGILPDSSTAYAQNNRVITVSQPGNLYDRRDPNSWQELKKSGYDFSGWNTAADGTGTTYQPGETITLSENITLYAQWRAKEYTVKYDTKGGNTIDNATVNYNDVVALPTPTREDSNFLGWTYNGATVAANSTYASIAGNENTTEIVLVAQWENTAGGEAGYFLSKQGATWNKAVDFINPWTDSANKGLKYRIDQYFHYGDTFTVTDAVPVVENASFIGWLDKARSDNEAAIKHAGDTVTYSYRKSNGKYSTYCLDALWAELKITGVTDTYDGNPKTTSNAVIDINKGSELDDEYKQQADSLIKKGELYYSTNQNEWSKEKPSFTNAGTYTVYAKQDVTVGGVTTTLKASARVVINKAEVTLKSKDLSKEYDGTALVNGSTALETETGWAEGEGADYTFTGSRTLVGSSANAFSYTLRSNTSKDNYEITKTEGTLTVTNRDAKYEITVKANSTEVTYDGQEHEAAGFEETEFTVNNQKYTVSGLETDSPKKKDAGKYTNNITGTPSVTDKDGNDVTAQFKVNTVNGSLTIKKRSVTLKSKDLSKEYDGTALVNGSTALETETGWAEGEGADYTFTGSRTLVGSSANAFSYTLRSNTSKDNYEITKTEGTLTVNPYDEAIIAKVSGTKATYVYDGTTYSVSGFDVEFEKPNGTPDSLSKTSVVLKPNKTAKASGTDVGDYKMNLEASDFEWNDANFSNVTISIAEDGLLKITPASIDPEKPTENTRFEVTGLKDVLYNGAEQKQTPTIKDTTTGKALVKDTDYTITCNTKDFTNAGTITYTLKGIGNYSGTREVSYSIKKRTVNLKSDTASKTYDGTALTRPGVTVTGDGFVKGEATAIATGSVINVTATPVVNTIAVVPTEGSKYNENNYVIQKDEGELSITAADITPTDPENPDTTRFTVEKPADTTYNGASQQQKPVVKDGEKVLVEGTDYKLEYPENTTDANANVEVTITGIGNYTGTRTTSYAINRKAVTLTSADGSKTYDGKPLTAESVTAEGFVEGQGATYSEFAKITEVTTAEGVENTFNYTLNEGTNADNYEITQNYGKLIVNPVGTVTVTIVGNSDTVTYDGKEHTVKGYVVTNISDTLYSEADIKFDGNDSVKRTEVGTSTMGITAENFSNTNTNFGTVNFVVTDGSLTITSASIDPELPDPTDPEKPTENTRFEVTGLKDVLYNGAEQKQTPTIKDTTTGKALVKDTDYTITCNTKDFTNAGTITYTLKGIGNYSGTREVSYSIKKRTVNLKSDTASKTYDGTALTRPGVTVTGDGFVKGEATAIATGSVINVTATPVVNTIAVVPTEGSKYNENNYVIQKDEGELSITAADITPTDPENPDTTRFTVEKPADTTYNGTSQQQKPVVKDGEKALVEGEDYTLTYPENTTDANANVEVTITGIGNYAGTRTTSYAINRKAVTLTSADGSKTYDGQPLTAESVTPEGFVEGQGATYGEFAKITEVTPAEGVDNTFSYTLNEGTLESNYNITTNYGSLTITPKTIVPDGPETPEEKKTGIEVTNPEGSKYDGTEHKNAPTVTDTKTGVTLTEGTDYTLTYSEDVTNAGTVTVTVTGKGNYTGEFNVTYEITKRDVVLTSATDSKKYDGTALRNENVEVTGDGFAEGEGATYSEFAEVTNVTDGAVANTFTYTLNENTLASNYNISTEFGTLTITPKTITPDQPETPEEEKTGITVENPGDVKYDGKDHAEKPVIKDEKTGVTLEEGKDYEIVYPEDIKNAGEITATVVGKGDYEGSFEIKFNILKRDVTFTSATDSKQYDGNALTNGNVEITGDGFIEGEGATFNVTGSITDVGSTNNAFTYAMNEGTNADNYNVTVVEGTLTVSEQPVVPTTATPTTPSNNTPARTNNVPARVVTNPTTTTPAPEATVEPEKAETTPAPTAKPEKIKEEATPQAAPKGHWALINLIAAMLSVVLAVVALLAKHAKDEDDEDKDDQVVANENEDDENESTRHRRWKVIATIDAILAVVVFILTENLAHDMVLVDKWTLLMVLFGLISIVSTYFARKWHEEDEDEDEESSQNA